MTGGTKKEYRSFSGKPILARAILPFIETGSFTTILITVPKDHIPKVKKLLASHLDTEAVELVEGGSTRQESVFFGLLGLEEKAPQHVLIHDGARPWVDTGTISRVLEGVRRWGACLPVVAAPDAIKEINEEQFIERHMDRRSTFGAQTPQGFVYSRILQAHREASQAEKVFIDDGEVYNAYAGPVFTVKGSISNRKITYSHDLEGL